MLKTKIKIFNNIVYNIIIYNIDKYIIRYVQSLVLYISWFEQNLILEQNV